MAIIFIRTGYHKLYKDCDSDFSEKVNLKEHTEPVHIKKKLNKISICDYDYSQKSELLKDLDSVH